MFYPKFKLSLSGMDFSQNGTACLGSQMHAIISFLDQQLPPYEWYAGDLEVTVKESTCSDFASQQIKKVGSQAKLVEICSRVDQFLSGVFLAVQSNHANKGVSIELSTEDDPFRPIAMDGVLIEIRAFDTSYFDFFAESDTIIKKLSTRFKKYANNKYTWNDLICIKKEDPEIFHPGEEGVICGFFKIQSEIIANKYYTNIDDWMYIVMLDNGKLIQAPESCCIRSGE